jgi:hypothetical protein
VHFQFAYLTAESFVCEKVVLLQDCKNVFFLNYCALKITLLRVLNGCIRCRQTQFFLFSSIYTACFGHIDHHQEFKYLTLN